MCAFTNRISICACVQSYCMFHFHFQEKDLIHKLFKVLVPRYQSLPAAVTSIHRISGTYPGGGQPLGVLELKGRHQCITLPNIVTVTPALDVASCWGCWS